MSEKYYAVANWFGKIEAQLIMGQKYIVQSCKNGMAEVYDLDGTYLKQTRVDNLDNWVAIK
ncbi:MAG: hypothetical protein RSF40_01660 [Oscillospiraceae bacterium]